MRLAKSFDRLVYRHAENGDIVSHEHDPNDSQSCACKYSAVLSECLDARLTVRSMGSFSCQSTSAEPDAYKVFDTGSGHCVMSLLLSSALTSSTSGSEEGVGLTTTH